jgi:hypothetical protein
MPRKSAAASQRTRIQHMQEPGAYGRARIDAIPDAKPLARSAYNHSINYRSVMLRGSARERCRTAGISDAVQDWVRAS